jgi:peroxiredoxin
MAADYAKQKRPGPGLAQARAGAVRPGESPVEMAPREHLHYSRPGPGRQRHGDRHDRPPDRIEGEIEGSMAETSNPVVIGSTAPDFVLPDSAGRPHALRDHCGSAGTLIAFICNHCPYVLHMRDALVRYAHDYALRGIRVIGINPNDARAYPADSPEKMAEVAPRLLFPYLVDAEQGVAQSYDAACTPDLYLYDGQLRLYYHGQFDASRPGGSPADGKDLRGATDRLLAGQPPPAEQPASIGCSIKWKPRYGPRL